MILAGPTPTEYKPRPHPPRPGTHPSHAGWDQPLLASTLRSAER